MWGAVAPGGAAADCPCSRAFVRTAQSRAPVPVPAGRPKRSAPLFRGVWGQGQLWGQCARAHLSCHVPLLSGGPALSCPFLSGNGCGRARTPGGGSGQAPPSTQAQRGGCGPGRPRRAGVWGGVTPERGSQATLRTVAPGPAPRQGQHGRGGQQAGRGAQAGPGDKSTGTGQGLGPAEAPAGARLPGAQVTVRRLASSREKRAGSRAPPGFSIPTW